MAGCGLLDFGCGIAGWGRLEDGGEKLVDRSRDGWVGRVRRAGGAEEFATVAVDEEELPVGVAVAALNEENDLDANWEDGVQYVFVLEPKGGAFAGRDDQAFDESGWVDRNIRAGGGVCGHE
jgi:hypothetical protein